MPAGAEPAVRQARLETRLESPSEAGSSRFIVVDYDLEPAGASAVPWQALPLAAGEVSGVRAYLAGSDSARELEVVVTGRDPRRLHGEIPLPVPIADGDPLRLRITYEVRDAAPVEGGDRRPVTLPIVTVLWPPAAPAGDTFLARVTLETPEARISSPFPSQVALETSAAGETVARFTLPVVPAFLRFSVSSGDGRRRLLDPDQLLQAAVLALLLGLGVFGWRRFRSGVR